MLARKSGTRETEQVVVRMQETIQV